MDDSSRNDKINRQITGWIVSIVALTCIVLGGLGLLVFMSVLIFYGAKEYTKILEHKGFRPSFGVIYTSAIAFMLLIFFRRFDLMPIVLTASLIASFLVVLFKGRQPYIANVATTALGFMYGGWLPCHIMLIRQIGAPSNIGAFKIGIYEGLYLIILVFLIVVATDIGGYYFGRRFGKKPLAPVISPKKTVEGSIGASLCAIAVAMCAPLFTQLSLLQAFITGLLVTVFAQLGDLSESMIKRDAGVKDSSNILPGHGGVMDRVDSYTFALPVAYYYFANFTLGNNIILEFFHYTKGLINAYF